MIDNELPSAANGAEEIAAAGQPASDAAAALQAIAAEAQESSAAEAEASAASVPADGAAEGLLGKVTGMLPTGMADKIEALVDRDGDGNPINDITSMASRLLGR